MFDVVIVGGAVTGSVLALALSHFSAYKMRVAVVEKFEPNYQEQGGFDARSIALAQGSLQKFSQIRPLAGALNLAELLANIATPIQQIHVSDQHHFGKTTLTAHEYGLKQLGAVVELADFGKQLSEFIAASPNISLFCPDTVADIQRYNTHCLLRLTSGAEINTPLIIAADGIQSTIAKQCGVVTELLKDYEQSALIANVEMSEPHQYQAFERFTSQGPLALLPLQGNRMSLVWCVRDPSTLTSLTDEALLSELQTQFGWRLGKFKRIGKRFVYPLSSQRAQSHIHHRLAIVGNAAQLLHPVAGQGFNLGLRDLFELATRLSQAFKNGQDLGSYSLLSAFDKARIADQTRIMRATSGLISIFSTDCFPVEVVRNGALIGLSHCKLAREWLMGNALGINKTELFTMSK